MHPITDVFCRFRQFFRFPCGEYCESAVNVMWMAAHYERRTLPPSGASISTPLRSSHLTGAIQMSTYKRTLAAFAAAAVTVASFPAPAGAVSTSTEIRQGQLEAQQVDSEN